MDDEVIVVEAEKAKTPIVEPMPGPSHLEVCPTLTEAVLRKTLR